MKNFLITLSGEVNERSLVSIIQSEKAIFNYIYVYHSETMYCRSHWHILVQYNDSKTTIKTVGDLFKVSTNNVTRVYCGRNEISNYFEH